MASWHIGMKWTPALALKLANLIDANGGNCPSVNKLRAAAARANSPILGQRAEAAYEDSRPTIEQANDEMAYAAFLRDAGKILQKAQSGSPGRSAEADTQENER